MDNGWTKELARLRNEYKALLASAKSALEFMEQVESDDWEEGGAETMPEVEAFRQVLAEIEATS